MKCSSYSYLTIRMMLLIYTNHEYSKRQVDSSHTQYFWCLYEFILILILYSYYFKFEVLIVQILSNTHDVVDFDSQLNLLNINKNHTISMFRVRILQYSAEGCRFALHAVFVFLLFCKCNNNLDCKCWWMIRFSRMLYVFY